MIILLLLVLLPADAECSLLAAAAQLRKIAQNVRRYEVCRKSIGFAEKAVQMIRL